MDLPASKKSSGWVIGVGVGLYVRTSRVHLRFAVRVPRCLLGSPPDSAPR